MGIGNAVVPIPTRKKQSYQLFLSQTNRFRCCHNIVIQYVDINQRQCFTEYFGQPYIMLAGGRDTGWMIVHQNHC